MVRAQSPQDHEGNTPGAETRAGLTATERKAVAEHTALRSPAIYEIVRRQGLEELARPVSSLWWSGVAGGLVLSTSLYCQGFLRGDEPRPLLTGFGYCIGFLIVILGRLQLFTENTITVVLPLLAEPSAHRYWRGARLWLVVLAANLAGTLLSVLLAAYAATPQHLAAFVAIAEQAAQKDALGTFLYGVPAGFLIAALVWIIPESDTSKALVITAITYMIAIGGLTHVVVGAAEVFLLVLAHELRLADGVLTIVLPALAGNIIGGTGLFAMIVYGQVRDEL